MAALSPDQKARLPEYRARWAGLKASTAPADRDMAVEGVELAYREAGLAPPSHILWCAGPRDFAESWQSECRRSLEDTNCSWQVFDRVLVRAETAVDHQMKRSVRRSIVLNPDSRHAGDVTMAVSDAFASGELPAPSPFRRLPFFEHFARRRRTRRISLGRGFGQHTLAPLGVFEFLHDVCGLEQQTKAMRGLWLLAASVGWVVPHRDVCWLVERHDILEMDPLGRLHGVDGPALAYPDGWSAYMWKGIRIPAWLIEHRDAITVRAIDREHDPVMRRCMIEILTPERFIAIGGATRASSDETGVLWRKLWWGFDAWAAVEVVNGSPEPDGTLKHYFLQVPPTVRSAREAVAWTYGMSEREYARLLHRT